MDDGIKGMIIAGIAFSASAGYYVWQWTRKRSLANDLRPTDGDPRAIPVVAALKQGNVMPLLQLVHGCGQDWDARDYYLDNLVVHAQRPSLDALCAQQPSPLAFLVRGTHAIKWAWEARGRGGASSVSEQNWALFEQRIRMAEQDLVLAAQGDPTDPTPHANLVAVAKASDVPPQVAWQHFQQAVARQPDHYRAHMHMRSNLAARWNGSHQEMFDFARRRAAEAPPGSDLPMILFDAHLDVWSHTHTIDGDPAGALSYLRRPEVRQELEQAYARTLAGPCRVRANTVEYRNEAAMVFQQWRVLQRLRVELDRIGPSGFTEYPWVYLRTAEGSTKDVVSMARLSVGLR